MKGPIARGTIRTSFVFGLRLVVQAGTLLLVARMLGPEQFGAFTGVAALALILGTLSTFGSHLVLMKEVSQEPQRREQVLSYAVPFTLLCGGVLLAVFLLVSLVVLREANVSIAVLIAIGVAEIWLQPLFGLPIMEHLALGRTARSQLLATLPLALRLLAAVAVLLAGPADPLSVYAWGYLAASIVALYVATATMPAPWPRPGSWRLMRKHELREAAGYAAISLSKAGPGELDKTLAVKLLPLSSAGLYAAGARVIGATTLPVIAMMLSALPKLFRGQDKKQAQGQFLSLMFFSALGYGTVLATALWFLAPMFDRVFGEKYNGIGQMICWLSIAVPGMATRIVAGNTLMAAGNSWMRVGFEALGLVVLIVAAVTLTSTLGAVGMAVALVSSEWSMALVGIALVIQVQKRSVS